jgi:hypothetical protein
MKIVDDITTVFSHQVRSFWHVIQDMICLGVCILASSSSFPYHARANNLFMFFTALTCIIFFYKLFRTDLYTNSVRTLGAWGAKYRCFYAAYYSVIAFLCASGGGFKGYAFALIWIISGGTYLVVADKIAKEENAKKEEVAKKIEENMSKVEGGCPYCRSRKHNPEKPTYILDSVKIKNTCKNPKCGKTWTEKYDLVDVELSRDDIPNMIDETIFS